MFYVLNVLFKPLRAWGLNSGREGPANEETTQWMQVYSTGGGGIQRAISLIPSRSLFPWTPLSPSIRFISSQQPFSCLWTGPPPVVAHNLTLGPRVNENFPSGTQKLMFLWMEWVGSSLSTVVPEVCKNGSSTSPHLQHSPLGSFLNLFALSVVGFNQKRHFYHCCQKGNLFWGQNQPAESTRKKIFAFAFAAFFSEIHISNGSQKS